MHRCFYDFAVACRRLGYGTIHGLRIQDGLLCSDAPSGEPVRGISIHDTIVNFAAVVQKIGNGCVDVKVRQGLPVFVEHVVEFPFTCDSAIKHWDIERGTSRRR